ncbi:hypothetical protein HYPSUDRAFT_206533 [Hypholoma sublateritium FD-334 SS-4]|uniref:Uncharacterized protein n=1 Tax=Hypholoma sublateritium (strain FD-334 SS-4) TaxID=945553 RepID=A0A0D2NDC0_HYPSF|nr:hypothetical protein HYPSUDRAFT_206533 [Hypholoma sublateritium FD-334 SS-4]
MTHEPPAHAATERTRCTIPLRHSCAPPVRRPRALAPFSAHHSLAAPRQASTVSSQRRDTMRPPLRRLSPVPPSAPGGACSVSFPLPPAARYPHKRARARRGADKAQSSRARTDGGAHGLPAESPVPYDAQRRGGVPRARRSPLVDGAAGRAVAGYGPRCSSATYTYAGLSVDPLRPARGARRVLGYPPPMRAVAHSALYELAFFLVTMYTHARTRRSSCCAFAERGCTEARPA